MKALIFMICSIFPDSNHQEIDTNFLRTNFDIAIGANKNIGLTFINDENANVQITTPFTPSFTLGMSFQYDANFLFAVSGSAGYNSYLTQINYIDKYGEVGYDVSDKFKTRNWFYFIDLTASKIFFLKRKNMLCLGAGVSITLQKEAIHETNLSAANPNNVPVHIYSLEYTSLKILPSFSPKVNIEFEPLKFKNSDNRLLLFFTYNYSLIKMSDGNFRYYKGNAEYSNGRIEMTNHFFSTGIKFRFGNL